MCANIRELKPGAALRLQKQLRDSAAAAQTRTNNDPPPSRPTQVPLTSPGHSMLDSIAGTPTSQLQHTSKEFLHPAAVAVEGATTVTTQSRSVEHRFLLLCI